LLLLLPQQHFFGNKLYLAPSGLAAAAGRILPLIFPSRLAAGSNDAILLPR
jgi:hypothetical protein